MLLVIYKSNNELYTKLCLVCYKFGIILLRCYVCPYFLNYPSTIATAKYEKGKVINLNKNEISFIFVFKV